jgi:hypothetical protein
MGKGESGVKEWGVKKQESAGPELFSHGASMVPELFSHGAGISEGGSLMWGFWCFKKFCT